MVLIGTPDQQLGVWLVHPGTTASVAGQERQQRRQQHWMALVLRWPGQSRGAQELLLRRLHLALQLVWVCAGG